VRWYSFDRLARWYDETRTLDRPTFDRFLGYFQGKFPAAEFPCALEVGVGTGRIAFPVSAAGYRVVGVDLSVPMLNRLRARGRSAPSARVDVVRGTATQLPLRNGSVDVVYAVHVLHLIPRWEQALDEMVRVLRPGGVLLLLRTSGGRDIPAVAREYSRLIRALGYRRPTLGVRSRPRISQHLRERGFVVRTLPARWRWTESVSLAESLRYTRLRAFSFQRAMPLPMHRAAMAKLESWARRALGPPGRRFPVRGELRAIVARRPERSRTKPKGRRVAPRTPFRHPGRSENHA
jgi:ubiquinone/menaquinone biosynthesis C-methylase UbiE